MSAYAAGLYRRGKESGIRNQEPGIRNQGWARREESALLSVDGCKPLGDLEKVNPKHSHARIATPTDQIYRVGRLIKAQSSTQENPAVEFRVDIGRPVTAPLLRPFGDCFL
jgi:hypothetical protein